MGEADEGKIPVRIDGVEGLLHFDGFILRHEDPKKPETYHQVISLLHVHRLQYGVEYKSPWPLVIGLILGALGLYLMTQGPGLGDLGLLLLLAGIVGFVIWAISTNRLAVVLDTPGSKIMIATTGQMQQLRELYLRIETAWLVAQAKLVKTHFSGPDIRPSETEEGSADEH